MIQGSRGQWHHDIRSSLNGVICMGSILEETELTGEQRDILKYMIGSAHKAMDLLEKNRASSEARDLMVPRSLRENKACEETVQRILVAEDDEINRLYLTTILKRQNWVIDEASDGFQAVELCRKKQYRMILMDVSMPGLDGFQAARQIRESGNQTPIVAITAHSLQDLQDNFLSAGVDEVLRKPFNEDHLLHTIKKLIDPSLS